MSKRKILALLLAVAMICSLCVSPALAAEDAGEPVAISDTVTPTFNDVEGHWAKNAIYRWAEAGIVQGDGDGSVNPGRNLRRCELASLLSRLLGLKATAAASTFSDVPADAWYKEAVLKCAAAGIMLGDGSGKANPEANIDRQQTIVMVARALGVKPSNSHSLDHFEDGEAVADWAAPYMAALTDMGILNGLPSSDGFVIAPADAINRASTFALLDKAIAEYVTTPTTVKVNDANKFVVINADAAENVTVTGTTAGIVVAAGTTADVTLDRATVGTLKVDAPVDVTISSGSSVTDLDANAAADVTNNGKVTNLNTNADDVTFDGNKPAAVNTAENVEPAKDSKGKEVTPAAASTGGTGGPSTTARADIVAAAIADHAETGTIAAEDLGKVTVSSSKVSGKTNEYNVTITGTDIMNHTNAKGKDGHWVGFGMPAAPEGETYTFEVDGVDKTADITGRTQEANGKTYHTVYFSGTEEEFKNETATVTVKSGAETVAVYHVSFKVTFWSAKNVKVVATGADADTAIAALKETTSMPWAHKFAAGLGLDAAVKGTTVTLTGETTKAALQNTDTGAEGGDGYLTYVLQVTDDVIKSFKVDNINAAPDKVGLDGTTLVVNQKFYEGGNKAFISHDVTFELVDAAGRTQDSVTVTVDGTGVSIEGMKKVTFTAGDTIIKTVVDDIGATVTAPSFPEHTEEVYYTQKWLDKDGEVATAPFTVGAEDATYTAHSVPVTATTLSVRMDGPEGSHAGIEVDNFEYEKVYGEAGLSLKDGKITVDATKLIAMVNSEKATDVNNLAHIMGNGGLANDVVFGVAYKTPTGAKKVAFAGTLAALDSKTADSDYRVLATNPNCYNNTLISYIPVATINATTKLVTFATEGDSDYCKWVDDDNNIVAVTKTVITLERTNMPQMTVTFKDGDKIVSTVKVDYNTKLAGELPELPTKAGYTAAWKDVPTANLVADATVNAEYTAIEYTLKLGETAQSEKYTVEGDGIVLDELTADKAGWEVIGWMCGEDLVEADIPAADLPEYADENDTITLIPVYGCVAEVSILEDTTAFNAWAGYPSGGFGTPEMDEDYAVTGELTLVEGFTGFNSVVEREQSGYYVAIEIKAPTGTDIDSTVPVIKVENEFAANPVKLHKLSDDSLWLLIHVADKPADGETATVGATKVTVTVNWNGVEDGENSFVCELDFSGVTLKGGNTTEEDDA